MKKTLYTRPKCSSKNVLQDAYINMNTGEEQTFDAKCCADCGAEFKYAEEQDAPADPKRYTVILMRPDNYGQDTFMESVEAANPAAALAEARRLVIIADFRNDPDETLDPTEYFCIALIEGQHKDINPE